MKKPILTLIILIILCSLGCITTKTRPPSIERVIKAGDEWWFHKKTEDPHFYKEIDLGRAVIHLCGSRARLWVEYNKRYPDTPFDLSSNVYMFTTDGWPAHIWLIVKIEDGEIILHKWATGHEIVRLLTAITPYNFKNADKYK